MMPKDTTHKPEKSNKNAQQAKDNANTHKQQQKGKVKVFGFRAFDEQHHKVTLAYTKAVGLIFDKATASLASSASKEKINPDKPFSFDDYPKLKNELNKALKLISQQLGVIIQDGTKRQWLFANKKNDAFLQHLRKTTKLTKAQLKGYQDHNLDALQAFQGRKVAGMGLSERIWKLAKHYQQQIEVGLDVGLGEGRSAQQLARDLKQNLDNPDLLFRRVRDKRGNLVLSKRAKAFHPGVGVYRSSHKNAMRLARTEINMAYREAEYLRWQALDFIVGFEVKRSNREKPETCKLCDKLKGKYPKTFKFVGWHPQCMCHALPILSDEDDFRKQQRQSLQSAIHGTKHPTITPKNLITDLPEGFKDWASKSIEKQKTWHTTPYFIRDNFVDGDLAQGLKPLLPPTPEAKPLSALERAKLRQQKRTPEQINEIKQRWEERRINKFIQELPDTLSLEERRGIANNNIEMEKLMGFSKQPPMSYEQANKGAENPKYGERGGYRVNCQTCTVTHLLRRRGFNVESKPNDNNSAYKTMDNEGITWKQRFLNTDGSTPSYEASWKWANENNIKRMTTKKLIAFLREKLSDNGIYEVYCAWQRGSAHVFCAEVTDGKVRLFDPQNGKGDVSSYIHSMKASSVMTLRIDNKIINPKIHSLFLKSS